jgi:hypothetical protein
MATIFWYFFVSCLVCDVECECNAMDLYVCVLRLVTIGMR